MTELRYLDLVLKHLGRPLTEQEQMAVVAAIPEAFRTAYKNCAEQRYEAHREADECRRELESLAVADFVEVWTDSQRRLGGIAKYRQGWTTDMDRQLVDGVAAGKSRGEMAKVIGVSRQAAIARYRRLIGTKP